MVQMSVCLLDQGKALEHVADEQKLKTKSATSKAIGILAFARWSLSNIYLERVRGTSNLSETRDMKIIMKTMMLMTFLSITMGLEIRGEIIRGYPCIKRYNQLYCPTPGSNYPKEKINTFIDDNKALIRRMFGEFHLNVDDDDSPSSIPIDINGDFNTSSARVERSTRPFNAPTTSNKVDSCESSIEIVTPYWASNSAGRIRAVVNTQHFEQAIQQEVCQNTQTKRCSGDCSCEQKYKWHRLLAFDPEDDCKGIFMDWFLFPSCCVCKCAPTPKA